ncbi:MAG: PspC domain-containing protein [Nanoarchaeota archaeon]|nr:PspC domain-containing protein [Nanoarchaeota archaeon]
MEKRLYRSKTDKVLFGVCGGIAEYFGIDSTIVRLITVALLLSGAGVLLLYIILAIIIPENPSKTTVKKIDNKNSNYLLGAGLLIIGSAMLLVQYNIIDWDVLWPSIIIILGVFFLWRNQKK